VFWNYQERRLRAFWRLMLHILVWLILSVIGGSIVGVVLGLMLVFGGGASQAESIPEIARRVALLAASDPLAVVLGQTAAVAAMLGSVWLVGRFFDRRKFVDFGFHFRPGWWLDLGFGLALGALLMALVFAIEQAAGWVTITGAFDAGTGGQPFLGAFALQVVVYIAVGINEETLSRGYQLKNMSEGLRLGRFGPRNAAILGWLVSSAIFGLLHLGNPGATWVSTFNIFLAGLLLGLGVLLTGDLAIGIGLHITWNLFQGNVFGFPVSGTGAGAPSFVAIDQGGPELWTGGAFGPEAGLVGILAMLVGAGLIVTWVRYRYGAVAIQEGVGQPPASATPAEPAAPV
jgi:membrane protease YdiL (CAAX protease family)